MTIINIERIKAYGEYIGFFDGLGFMYKIDNQLFTFNRNGLIKL